MKKQQLIQDIAKQEFINDQLTAELHYLDQLLRQVGFPEGVASVKAVAEEIIEQGIVDK